MGGGNGSPEIWISKYHIFLQTDNGREQIPHFAQEIQLAEQYLADEELDTEELQQSHHETQDDWMALCQLNPIFAQALQENHNAYWRRSNLPQSLLQECPKWITTQRHLMNSNADFQWHRQLPPVDTASLNVKQRYVYDLVQSHYSQCLSGHTRNPLLIIVSGTAGTGKSYHICLEATVFHWNGQF